MCKENFESNFDNIEPIVRAICESFKLQDNEEAYQKLKKVIEDEINDGNDSIPRLIRIGLNTIKEFI